MTKKSTGLVKRPVVLNKLVQLLWPSLYSCLRKCNLEFIFGSFLGA